MKTATLEILIILEDGRESSRQLTDGEWIIGRDTNASLSLDDEYLSRQHSRLSFSKGKLSVCDMGSFNGTFVNGQKIHEECFLVVGDVVKIGRCRILVKTINDSRPGLRVYTPDLPPKRGMTPISRAKEARLAPPYSTVEELPPVPSLPRKQKLQTKTRRARSLRDLSRDLPPSISGTQRYIPEALPDEESENPTPIPDPKFTASAIFRASQTDSSGLERVARDKERRGLRVIAQLARVLHSVEDIGDFFDLALPCILEVIPAERCVLMRLDRKRRGLYVEAVKSALESRSDQEARKMGVSHTIARRVIRDRVSVLVNDAKIDDRFREASSIIDLQVRSILCTPIWYQDKVSGLIYLDHILHTYAFSEADREFLVAVANLIALAMRSRRR